MRWAKLPELAESVPLATPLARFGKSIRTASPSRWAAAGRLSPFNRCNTKELAKAGFTHDFSPAVC